MEDNDMVLLQDYLEGVLGSTQKKAVENRLESDAEFREKLVQLKLARHIISAEEDMELLDIMHQVDASRQANDHKQNDNEKRVASFNRKWIIATVLAGLIVILFSILIRLQKIDKGMIAQDLLIKEKSFAERGNESVNLDSIIEVQYIIPMKNIRELALEQKYDEALSGLDQIDLGYPNIIQNKEYTRALLLYLKNGRNDPTFHTILNKILDDPTHSCYSLATQLDSRVNNLWGRLKG